MNGSRTFLIQIVDGSDVLVNKAYLANKEAGNPGGVFYVYGASLTLKEITAI